MATQPIVESTDRARVGCYTFGSYRGLKEQFTQAGLSLDLGRNRWWDVYDFTPDDALGDDGGDKGGSSSQQQPHVLLMPAGERHGARFKPLPAEVATQLEYSEERGRCLVPYTAPQAAAAKGK